MRRLIAIVLLLTIAVSAVFGFAASLNVESARLTVVSNTLASTSLNLTLSNPGPIEIGNSVSVEADLNGATSDASGSVQYSVYSDSGCASPFSAAGSSSVTNGNVDYDSDAVVFNTPGTYYWQATYSGDGENRPALSPCGDTVLVVIEPAPSTTSRLYLSMSPSNQLLPADAAGSVDLEPRSANPQTFESSEMFEVLGPFGWQVSLNQIGPSNYSSSTLRIDVWTESGSCGSTPGVDATNYAAGLTWFVPDRSLPDDVSLALDPNLLYEAADEEVTICLKVTNITDNNGASHHFEFESDDDTYLRGPF